MVKNKKVFLIFFGAPGSGKGTQADLLGEEINLPVISPGELLRHECDIGSEIGESVKEIIKHGDLVSNEIVNKLVEKKIFSQEALSGAIFDGYPRKSTQLDFILHKFKELTAEGDIIRAILIAVSGKKVIERLSGRRACDCGEVYHLIYNPPKIDGICDKCGQKLYIRQDDKLEIIENRLNLYHKTSKLLLDYWDMHKKLITINGEQDIEKVKQDIKDELKKIGAL
ncbi:MAG: nucleoside monophosphate kinase [Patescibacteria group bacterium]|nr:nucleoside monophosphate kinase [Patescibacteria group bacterium]